MPSGPSRPSGGRGQPEVEPILHVGTEEGSSGSFDCSEGRPRSPIEGTIQEREDQQEGGPTRLICEPERGSFDTAGEGSGSGSEGSEVGEGDTSQSEPRGRNFFERAGDHAHMSQESSSGAESSVYYGYDWFDAKQRTLDRSVAKSLEYRGERAMPEAFQALVQFKRPLLFELARGPDFVLMKKMHQLTGSESSAQRLSFWNGYDFSTSLGVRSAITKIDKEKPLHVWISMECGPYSKMQNVNQRTEKQREDLKLKRANCLRQYIGGLLIYMHCYQQGIPCTWEWAETVDAW